MHDKTRREGSLMPVEPTSYVTTSTSNVSSSVDDIELSVSPAGLARKVIRATIVQNPNQADNTVKVTLIHQKRSSKNDPWTDESGTGLTATTPLSPSKFPLDTGETQKLLHILADLYDLGEGGVRPGRVVLQIEEEEEIIRTDSSRAALIRRIIDADHGEEVWSSLVDLEPTLSVNLAVALLHQQRQAAIDQFEQALTEEHDENYWNTFLTANCWMFGGSNIAVIDERRIDIRHTTDIPFEVDGGFMDIVELKRPDAPFWTLDRQGNKVLYRDKFLVPHFELQAAIAQTGHYILQAEKYVANSDFREQTGIIPLKPRGLVVHGRSVDWNSADWIAFRMLNDSLHGIQVMTFDHLLIQARRMLVTPTN